MYKINYSKVMYPGNFEKEFDVIFSEYERQPDKMMENITEQDVIELNKRLNELLNSIK